MSKKIVTYDGEEITEEEAADFVRCLQKQKELSKPEKPTLVVESEKRESGDD